MTPRGDRVRVRVGPLVAEVPAAAALAAGAEPGRVVTATWPVESTRLVPLAPAANGTPPIEEE